MLVFFYVRLLSVCQRYNSWKQFTTISAMTLYRYLLLSVCQRYNSWKQFTTVLRLSSMILRLLSVCQRYNSWKQFTTCRLIGASGAGCYQCVKDTILESNSQPLHPWKGQRKRCYQCVKDTILESNSQHYAKTQLNAAVVISVSKIQFLKAIHNVFFSWFR